VRPDGGFEWPRLFDLLVEFSEDEVVDCCRNGLERCSDTGREDSIFAAWVDTTDPDWVFLGLRLRVGAVLLLCTAGGFSLGTFDRYEPLKPLSFRSIAKQINDLKNCCDVETGFFLNLLSRK
jgi:hypothetical protein